MLKSLITKHSEDIDCSALLSDLQFALKVSERSKQIYSTLISVSRTTVLGLTLKPNTRKRNLTRS